MNTLASMKGATSTSTAKSYSTQAVSNKVGVKRQPHKISPLYETPFKDVVTNEYVRGYN